MTAICPACPPHDAAPFRPAASSEGALSLHLPDIHCAGCIAGVERILHDLPGVTRARVNLSLRRVAIEGVALDPDRAIEALAAGGYRAREIDAGLLPGSGPELRDLLMRTGVAGFAMMNVMLMSVAVWSGADASTARLLHLLAALIAVPAVAFSGRPFFRSAVAAVMAGRLNMDVPITLALVLSTGVSFHGALTGAEQAGWFDAALALTFFLLIGRCLDHAGRRAARSAAAELAALDIPQAILLSGGERRAVRAETLVPGDLVELRPGDRCPVDGTVEDGSSELDRSALTGESAPVPVSAGGAVAAGEINLSGLLTLRVARAGQDTTLARMTALVAAAESQRSRWSGLADRAARIYAPLVHILSAAAFAGWWIATGDGWRALDVAISVLVITCPCALGLAVPAVSTVATGRLFRLGLLVKSSTALERLAGIDLVAFDKTGTLTTGAARLVGPVADHDLALAAGLAAGSSHPYSRALVVAARNRGVAPARVDDVREVPGIGVEGTVQGMRMRLGRPEEPSGSDGVALTAAGRDPVTFDFDEEVRPEAMTAVDCLRAHGYGVAMLSGDGRAAVADVAARLRIDEALSRLMPCDKSAWVGARQASGNSVLMVGDGMNDAAGLASADAGLAPSTALEAARSAADVVLISGDLRRVVDLLAIARSSLGRMRQNIVIAAGYNLIAIPLALAGLASPLMAALAMSMSSLTVTLNSIRRFT